MRNISEFKSKIEFLFTDIDDTLTDHGRLGPEAYSALWNLYEHGIQIIPVTGRPAGWCEMIARLWPVAGVIGENGGFYFRYHMGKMRRYFALSESEISLYRKKLDLLRDSIPQKIPGAAIASDQFCRLMDLAIDFCEDVKPLPESAIDQIVSEFQSQGAQAKVSSIHVNGWFGSYDKLTTAKHFLLQEFNFQSDEEIRAKCAFIGDSPNDEPMFSFFRHSIAVANIKNWLPRLKSPPAFVCNKNGGAGFAEAAKILISGQA
ncbi:MAG: HAD-IIB family hydrolase [Bdellovibrionaceae bacterium]|nr:HAD-IIB family hydrolase [Pseudobdellovibrionaceae bacterium]